MNAVVTSAYGLAKDVLVLKQVPKPSPGKDEALVRVRAAGVHAGTVVLVAGIPWMVRLATGGLFRPKPDSVVGTEFSGEVVELGPGVTDLRVGDAVYAEVDFTTGRGCFAEFVCVPAASLSLKPTNLSFTEAAAVPVSGQTALTVVRDKARIAAGQKVLINGASGGVGSFAVQIAASLGADVTAVCSSRNAAAAAALGASHVIDYDVTDFTLSDERFDCIIDLVGNRRLDAVLRVVTPNGTYLSAGGPPESFFRRMGALLFAKLHASQTLAVAMSAPSKQHLVDLCALIEQGKVKPHIDRTYTLEHAAEAVSYVAEGHAQGKVIITIVPDGAN